jgi:pyruvate/2-oxoglutarate dehydrogenase complex dihydrolipoamide dehydrogenase (E3) component
MREPVDLAVVGGGTAGLVAAKTAAGLGAQVALVEADRTGGECLWTGFVPSKALLAAARTAQAVHDGSWCGVTARWSSWWIFPR